MLLLAGDLGDLSTFGHDERDHMDRVALLLHGKIGLWSIKSANVPSRDRELKGTEKLLAHAVSVAPKSPPVASNVSLWELERKPHSMLLGFARFASKSVWQRVIEPNRRAGLQLNLFLHSWHPEIGASLDAWYNPVASLHEPPHRIHKVASHHLSMKRGLALVLAHATSHELVCVCCPGAPQTLDDHAASNETDDMLAARRPSYLYLHRTRW